MTSSDLVRYSEAQAAVEPYVAGGLIEHAIGEHERGMEGIIEAHLGTIALLNARGDTVPERPTYVFDPKSGLLINYALRRDSNPDRAGLFADIVTLDTEGKPKHGVEVINPFASLSGYINVAVGENNHGFAPSSVQVKMENDPTTTVPPNIEFADLLVMLQAEPIAADMSLPDFLASRRATQDEMRARTMSRQRASYPGTVQGLAATTDPNLHVIISDREDSSALAEASRQVGVFPIVIPAQEIVFAAFANKKIMAPLDSNRLGTFVSLGRQDTVRETLSRHVPAFLTLDFENMHGRSQEDRQKKLVPLTSKDELSRPVIEPMQAVMDLLDAPIQGQKNGFLTTAPIFSRIYNLALVIDPAETENVQKIGHGQYEMGIDTSNPKSMNTYTNWIRKARLDYALTLYLRGLNQL